MKVLILGSGGREHALAWKVAQSPKLKTLYCAPVSDAIASIAQAIALDILNPEEIVLFCQNKKIDFVIIGPEGPLAAGAADALTAAGIAVFGPNQAAAQLESSKAFAKAFMQRHNLPTARWEAFTAAQKAKAAVQSWPLPIVIKADGLAAGKGVQVCTSRQEALKAVAEFMEQKTMGAAGQKIIIEEGLSGPEISAMAFCDGQSYTLLPLSRDHKRLKDGDRGPNTGGMGAFAPVDISPKLFQTIKTDVFDRALAGLKADGLHYCGVLYAGLMLTKEGPKVLEFNCRFGDPEAQALLPLIDTDLLELVQACVAGRLATVPLQIKPGACLCVVLASEGYPEKSLTGRPITGLPQPPSPVEAPLVFHAGTTKKAGQWLTAGGRVLGVTATGTDLAQARENAYAAAAGINFEGLQKRMDIAVQISVKV